MGNADLIIIINGLKAIKVMGTEYFGIWYDMAIEVAIKRYRDYIEQISRSAGPEEIPDGAITKIEVFELI